jgi:hypothetical protein
MSNDTKDHLIGTGVGLAYTAATALGAPTVTTVATTVATTAATALVAIGPIGWLALGGAALFGAILASDAD